PPRLLPDVRELVSGQSLAGVDVDRDPGGRPGLRVRRATMVRAAVHAALRARLRARHAPDDRPHVRAGHLVLAADDEPAHRQLRLRALAIPRAEPAAPGRGAHGARPRGPALAETERSPEHRESRLAHHSNAANVNVTWSAASAPLDANPGAALPRAT